MITTTMTTAATASHMYILRLLDLSPPSPRPATSYDMDDLAGRTGGRVIRVSSARGCASESFEKPPRPFRGTPLDGVGDLLFGKRDTRCAHVDRVALGLAFGAQDFVGRNGDDFRALPVLEEELDGARHRAELHEVERRILRVSIHRGGDEQEPRAVSKRLSGHGTQERDALPVMVHRDLHGHVLLGDDGISDLPRTCGGGKHDLGPGPRPGRHDPHLHPQSREAQVVHAIVRVHVAEDHRPPQTPKPLRNCSAISASSPWVKLSKSETDVYSARCSSL